jgi:tetratricopeptide (TPR) repeat protein
MVLNSTRARVRVYDFQGMSGHASFPRLRETVPGRRKASAFFLPLLALALAAWPSIARADVIYLKNGGKITARVTREDDKQVYYEVAGGEVALARTLVDHIEKSPGAEASQNEPPPASGRARDLPLPSPPASEPIPEGASPVIKDGAIDEAYLRQLDEELSHNSSPENARRLKQAYQQAAVFLVHKGDADGAIAKYQQALKELPHDLALTVALGTLQVSQSHCLEALDLLLPASDRFPDSADILLLLGSAYYGMENLDQAIAEWNKSLAIQDNPRLSAALAKAEREREVTGSYLELRSEHFLIRYEGRETEKFSEEALNSLEGSFRDLVLDLDYAPREEIIVLLYPNEAFRDITRSPSWVGATNDGKIRIPISGLSKVTVEVARVLKHELTHSFVRQMTLGHCPTWFNEGLAQLEEGATTASLGTQLARAMAADKLPPYSALEDPFIKLPPSQVGLAYAKSLAGLEYLRDNFTMGEVRLLLKMLPSSSDFNSLLQDQIRLDYPAFEQEVTNYIVKRYGT